MIESLGGRSMECECGETHALSSRIARRATGDIGEAALRLLPYGRAVVFATEEDWLSCGGEISAALGNLPLEVCRFMVEETDRASRFAPLFHLPEDVRCAVAVGAAALPAARYFCTLREVPYLFVPLSPRAEEVFFPLQKVRVGEKTQSLPARLPDEVVVTPLVLRASGRELAASYGRMASKLIALVDYRVYCACAGRTFCARCYDRAREALADVFSLAEDTPAAECAETLLSAELTFSASAAYLGEPSLNYGGERCMADLLPAGDYGDRAFRAACKLADVYASAFACEFSGTLAVPDYAGRRAQAAAISGLSEKELALRAERALPRAGKKGAFPGKLAPSAEELEKTRQTLAGAREVYAALGGAEEYGEEEYRRAFLYAAELAERYNVLVFLRDAGIMEYVREEGR